MNINFHYCAIKAIAILAGFNEGEAEIIATYSQFVDDYKTDKAFTLTNIPSYCAPLKVPSQANQLQTVPSGFDYLPTIKYSVQENIIVPFHFIPPKSLRETGESYKTVPAFVNDKSIIDDICNMAARQCVAERKSRKSLVFLGTALHVFSDTYAHSCFNGFWDGANNGRVQRAVSDKGEKRSYTGYEWLPAIGHATLGTAPDDSDIDYTFVTGDSKTPINRTNWLFFADCAVEILKYFLDVLGLEPSTYLGQRVARCVEAGCKVKGTDMRQLQTAWQAADPALSRIGFNYIKPSLEGFLSFDKNTLPEGVSTQAIFEALAADELAAQNENAVPNKILESLPSITASASDLFYEYNFAAYTMRKVALNGKIA